MSQSNPFSSKLPFVRLFYHNNQSETRTGSVYQDHGQGRKSWAKSSWGLQGCQGSGAPWSRRPLGVWVNFFCSEESLERFHCRSNNHIFILEWSSRQPRISSHQIIYSLYSARLPKDRRQRRQILQRGVWDMSWPWSPGLWTGGGGPSMWKVKRPLLTICNSGCHFQ